MALFEAHHRHIHLPHATRTSGPCAVGLSQFKAAGLVQTAGLLCPQYFSAEDLRPASPVQSAEWIVAVRKTENVNAFVLLKCAVYALSRFFKRITTIRLSLKG